MSTIAPLHIVNAAIEYARIHNKELWLVLQDMRKAYDSVGWKQIKRSLQRIKMNQSFIDLLGNIHNLQCNSIITEFGLSSGYIVQDGLDQGKT